MVAVVEALLQAPDEGPEVFEGETMLPELDMSLAAAIIT